jgi:excisionase family DNA binding protein
MERISIKDAAEILNVHENTVRSYIEKDILTGYQALPGGKISLDKEEVEKLSKAVK